jgi:hypothetical protein
MCARNSISGGAIRQHPADSRLKNEAEEGSVAGASRFCSHIGANNGRIAAEESATPSLPEQATVTQRAGDPRMQEESRIPARSAHQSSAQPALPASRAATVGAARDPTHGTVKRARCPLAGLTNHDRWRRGAG